MILVIVAVAIVAFTSGMILADRFCKKESENYDKGWCTFAEILLVVSMIGLFVAFGVAKTSKECTSLPDGGARCEF